MKGPDMTAAKLAKGCWYVLSSYRKNSTSEHPVRNSLLIHITASAAGSDFCEGDIMDTGAKIRIRLVYFGGFEASSGKFGAEIPLPEKGPGWHHYFSHCSLVTEAEARQYCADHHVRLPPEERASFIARVTRWFSLGEE